MIARLISRFFKKQGAEAEPAYYRDAKRMHENGASVQEALVFIEKHGASAGLASFMLSQMGAVEYPHSRTAVVESGLWGDIYDATDEFLDLMESLDEDLGQ